jgi:TctA family transporter
MALILGVLMVHGIPPGPALLSNHADLFWGLVMSFWIGNVILVVLNIPLISVWVYILTIPYRTLYPAILMFICMGAVSLKVSVFDIYSVIVFSILGVLLRAFGYPLAPLILGFVLGPLTEEHFRRAMILSGGQFSTFVDRPVSATIIAAAVASTAYFAFHATRKKTSQLSTRR